MAWYETQPPPHTHFSWGKASNISLTASWARDSTWSCCATPLIPENDVIVLKVPATPIPNPLPLSHAHASQQTCWWWSVLSRGCVWTDGRRSWLTGCEDDVNCSRISVSKPADWKYSAGDTAALSLLLSDIVGCDFSPLSATDDDIVLVLK